MRAVARPSRVRRQRTRLAGNSSSMLSRKKLHGDDAAEKRRHVSADTPPYSNVPAVSSTTSVCVARRRSRRRAGCRRTVASFPWRQFRLAIRFARMRGCYDYSHAACPCPESPLLTLAITVQRPAGRRCLAALRCAASPAARAADAGKTLHVALRSPRRASTPQFASDAASDDVIANIIRGDARLRLPRAPGQARAAHARGDAGRGGRRQDLSR